MNRRSELLADRIEEGADGLATFAEELSEAEWHTPVSGTDSRSIGVIVHHVATVYPIEIQLAQTIASGQAVTEVNSCARIVARRPTQSAHSRMTSWTRRRSSR